MPILRSFEGKEKSAARRLCLFLKWVKFPMLAGAFVLFGLFKCRRRDLSIDCIQ